MDKYKRRTPVLQIRDKVLIMCSGETEEIYFNYYKNSHKRDLQNVSIKIVTHKKSNPIAVVKAALIQKPNYDEVWAVFDKDDFPDFDDAIILALDNKINCAFSNEAIEYWFLLHFENKTGAMSRNMLNTELERKLGFEYQKSLETIQRTCKIISGKLNTAEDRAKVVHDRYINFGGKTSDWCSCTTIYKLTKKLCEWSKAKK
jgi:hypothetical protein